MSQLLQVVKYTFPGRRASTLQVSHWRWAVTEAPCKLTGWFPACRVISFSFKLQSGNIPGAAFECALASTGAGGNSSAQEWTPCSSPVQYADLTDGGYSFSVRAQGEQLADSRAFFKVGFYPRQARLGVGGALLPPLDCVLVPSRVSSTTSTHTWRLQSSTASFPEQDTTPPVPEFLGALPAEQTAAAVANVTFNATDLSAVNYSCRVSAAGTAPMQGAVSLLQSGGPTLNSLAALGEWQPCYSPLVLYWLLPGAGPT